MLLLFVAVAAQLNIPSFPLPTSTTTVSHPTSTSRAIKPTATSTMATYTYKPLASAGESLVWSLPFIVLLQ